MTDTLTPELEVDPLACPDCDFVAKTENGLHLHRVRKHDAERTGDGSSHRRAEHAPKIPGGRSSRQQSLKASLGVLYLGVGILNAKDGEILAGYIPAQAQALDMAARDYKWAEKVCEYLTMAGPMSLLATAFIPPVVLVLANHGLVPARAAGMATVLGASEPAPPPPPSATNGHMAMPTVNPDGSVSFGGMEFSADEVAAAAKQFGASSVFIQE